MINEHINNTLNEEHFCVSFIDYENEENDSKISTYTYDENTSSESWETQKGKYMILFEPYNPWYLNKIPNNKIKDDTPPPINQKINNQPDIPIVTNKIIFNTVACLILTTVLSLVIVRIYINYKK